jgi:oxygen-dependent protoporphyrinogen oxidase
VEHAGVTTTNTGMVYLDSGTRADIKLGGVIMKGKLLILAGAAVGYVLGTRAGRQRYEEIKDRADTLWHDPRVQQKVSDAQHTVKAKAPEIQDRLTEAAARATEKVKSTVHRHDESDNPTELNADGRPDTQNHF